MATTAPITRWSLTTAPQPTTPNQISRAGLEQFLPVPLHLLFDDPAVPAADGGGEADAVAPVVAGDGPQRADAAQAVQVLDDQGLGASPRGADAGRRPARAAADHDHVVAAEHGHGPRRPGERSADFCVGRDAGQHFAHVAGGGRLIGRLARQTARPAGSASAFASLAAALPIRVPRSIRASGRSRLSACSRETSAQPPSTYNRSHSAGWKASNGSFGSAPGPSADSPAVHRVGRDLEQHVGRELLLGW